MRATAQWTTSAEMANFLKFCKHVKTNMEQGNKILIFGNGGSSSEASHIAAEFVGKCVVDSGALPAICLNDSSASVTSIANDWGFEFIFSRQLDAHARAGDIAIGLSTSGGSINVLNGLSRARSLNCVTALWTSTKYLGASNEVDYLFKAPTNSTPRAQELHLQMGHALAEYVESN
jgi:D-sedoheptulose 7-phosphate isomerase